MADSKRLRILKALTTQIKKVKPSNGYTYDLSASVSRGRPYFGRETPLPWVSILESLDPDSEPFRAGQNISQKDLWVLLINGWVEEDPEASINNPTDPAHNLMAEVKKALASIMNPGTPNNRNPDYLLGDLIEGFRMEAGTVRPPDELSAKAYFYLRVGVEVAETLTDPFAD